MNNGFLVNLNPLAALRRVINSFLGDEEDTPLEIETKMVTDKRRLLKIKLKSLAAEAAIIRQEEIKAGHSKLSAVHQLREEMHNHRVMDLREETRATLLAYSYIRGRKYRDIEGRSSWNVLNVETATQEIARWISRLDRIRAMVAKYGNGKRSDITDIRKWLDEEGQRALPPRPPKKPYTGPKGPVAPTPANGTITAATVAPGGAGDPIYPSAGV